MSRIGDVLRLVFPILLVVVAGLLCLRVALVQLLPPSVSAGPLTGNHPEIYFKAARLLALSGVPPTFAKNAARAAAQAPLAEEPYLVMAAVALERSSDNKANALLAEAVRRNPRIRQARLLLLNRYAKAGDADGVAQQLMVLARITPDASEMLLATLGQLLIDPTTRIATIGALQESPLLDGVLNSLAIVKADPDIILEAARGRSSVGVSENPEWQRRLVYNLVEEGSFARARELWMRYTPQARGSSDEIYNPTFREGLGAPPFNWALSESEGGVAEIRDEGGVELIYYGREPTVLASQLLTLSPGSYGLAFEVAGQQPEGSGELNWTLNCANVDAPIATIGIQPMGHEARRARGAFTVPTDCRAQWLRIVGLPGDMPRTLSIELSQVTLER